MVSDTFSGATSKIDYTKEDKHKFERKATTSAKLASKNVPEQSLVDLILLEESSRTKCSKVGESYCYKTLQQYLNINDGLFGTRINDTFIYFQQKRIM